MKVQQIKQDTEYDFPYHHIPKFRNYFLPLEVWGWSKNYTSAIEFLLQEIKKESLNIKTIFDIGCGDGRLTKELNSEFKNINTVGIDYSSKAIGLATAMNPDIEFHNIDITLQNSNLHCDAVTLIEVFEHIHQDQCIKFVESISGILNENGILYLTVPHINVPISKKHFQHFDVATLKMYFEKTFAFEDIQYIQKNSFFLRVLNKLMHNNLYVIKNRKLNTLFYNYYKKYHFHASKNNCERIYIKLRKRKL